MADITHKKISSKRGFFILPALLIFFSTLAILSIQFDLSHARGLTFGSLTNMMRLKVIPKSRYFWNAGVFILLILFNQSDNQFVRL